MERERGEWTKPSNTGDAKTSGRGLEWLSGVLNISGPREVTAGGENG